MLGFPILLGPSRKSFIGYTLDLPPVAEATLWDYLQRAAFAMVNTFEE